MSTSVTPLKELPAELEKIKAKYAPKARDLEPVLREVDDYLRDRTGEAFRTRTTPDGRRWAGRADLVETGGLFLAATAPGEVKDGTLTRKTKHKLAHLHQRGTRKPRAKGKRRGKKTKSGNALARAAKLAKRAVKVAAQIAAGEVGLAALGALELLAGKKKKRRPARLKKPRTGKYRIPPRPFEGIADQDREHILAVLARHVLKGNR